MRELADDIATGASPTSGIAERDAGYPNLERLREQHAGAAVAAFEAEIRSKIGQGAVKSG